MKKILSKYALEHGIKVVDMSGNPITETSPDAGNPTPTTPATTTPATTSTTESPAPASTPAAMGIVFQATDVKAKVKVTSDNAVSPTVEYVAGTDKSAKKVTVPNAVSVNGVTYQVTSVAPKAFAKNKKLKSVIIGKNVTSIGKNALKGTNKKLVIKVPKKQVEKYKTYFKGKGNKSVKVTK